MQEDVEVSFCDLCGTSVPAGDLATGAAVQQRGKTIGACCLPGLRGDLMVGATHASASAIGGAAVVRPGASAETRILPADRVRIQGRLVMLIRKY